MLLSGNREKEESQTKGKSRFVITQKRINSPGKGDAILENLFGKTGTTGDRRTLFIWVTKTKQSVELK